MKNKVFIKVYRSLCYCASWCVGGGIILCKQKEEVQNKASVSRKQTQNTMLTITLD